MSFSMPEQKTVKAQFVLGDPVYDPGRRWIKIRDLQVLGGNLQHWSIAQPRLIPELNIIHRMLKGSTPDRIIVSGTDLPEWACEDHEDLIEYARVLVGSPELWVTSFTSSFSLVLSPAER